MNKNVGILLCLGASVIDGLGSTTILAFAVDPCMLDVLIKDIAARGGKPTDAILAAGIFRTIHRTSGQQRSQFCDGDAKHLFLKYMVYTFLPVWDQFFQSLIQPFHYLTEENAALGEGIEKRSIRILE